MEQTSARPQVAQPKSQLVQDKNLLLLGLQLLNKGLKLPYAVVQPRVQTPKANENGAPGDIVATGADSPQKPESEQPNSRKRKRNGNSDLSEVEKREKR